MLQPKKTTRSLIVSLSHHKKQIQVTLVLVLVFMIGWVGGNGTLNYRLWINRKSETGLPANLNYTSVNQVYNLLRKNYDGRISENTVLDGLKQGLANATGDPYTEYMTPAQAKDFNSQLSGTFDGIGAELSKDSSSIVVISPLAGTPAQKAGLKPHDVIEKINGLSTAGMSVDTATNKIRGLKGTTVKLTIVRNNNQQLNLDIVRDTISIPSVTSKILDGNIGYMAISQFGDDTSNLSQQAANKFKDANVKGVILDLRGDPGGYLSSAVSVSSLWLPSDKTILTERRGGKIEQTYNSNGSNLLGGIPTVVLIDSGSASASEITSGALHDNKSATLIGVKSYGKGSVQEPGPLSNGGIFKVTVARWYTPDGKNIDKQGIEPDKVVNRSDDDIKNNRDPQLDAATQLLTK